ncbi:MAG TPA: hypothetical protein VLH79_09015 [Chthonomonadales bacterium]|nr:hypothetical protein [Chthonomonadales bacterium]
MVRSRRWLSLAALLGAASFLTGCDRPDPLVVPASEAPSGAVRVDVTTQPTADGPRPAAPGHADTAAPVAE